MKTLAAKGRRASKVNTAAQKSQSSSDNVDDDDVGVPASMVSKKKNKRQFSVLRSDESAVSPFAQIYEAIKHNHGTKTIIQTELKTLRSGMTEQVNGLQNHFSERVQEISGRLESVEKYMFRQDVISKMRENAARKKRQERARTPSPKKGAMLRPVTADYTED